MSRPVRVISDQAVNGKAAVLLPQADIQEVEEASEQAEEVEGVDEKSGPAITRRPRGSGKKVNHNVGLSLVSGLNFRPGGKQAFEDFVGEKCPKSDMEVTLAAVYYMQHKMELSKISPSHIMTAFKEAGKESPADVRQTIRNVKYKKGWLDFTDIEDVQTTTQGDNFVEHKMGHGE
jgi:hypothetical protein